MFRILDADANGQIDEAEGIAVGRVLAGGDAAAGKQFWEELIAGADSDRNGTVSQEEYVAFGRKMTNASPATEVVSKLNMDMARLEEQLGRRTTQRQRTSVKDLSTREKAVRVFRYLDTDSSGTLRLGELLKLAKTDKEAFDDLPNIFIILDMEGFRKGDGLITLEEWMTMAEDMPELSDHAFAQSLSVMMERALSLTSTSTNQTASSQRFIRADGSLDRDALVAATFERLDVSADGKLDLSEYLNGAENMVSPEEAGADFTAWGIFQGTADGRLDLGEFKHGLLSKYATTSDDELMLMCRRLERHLRKPVDVAERNRKLAELFNLLDADSSGSLTVSEVLRLAKGASASNIEQESLELFFESLGGSFADEDGQDGHIRLQEWTVSLLDSMAQRTEDEFDAFCNGMRDKLADTKAKKVKAKKKPEKKQK